jgi:cell division protein FtsB
MIDEEEIKHLQRLSKNDLAMLVSKQNEAELQRLREENQKLREEIERLKGL